MTSTNEEPTNTIIKSDRVGRPRYTREYKDDAGLAHIVIMKLLLDRFHNIAKGSEGLKENAVKQRVLLRSSPPSKSSGG